MSSHYQTMESPAGPLYLVEKDGRLRGIVFRNQWPAFRRPFDDLAEVETSVLAEATRQLSEYFQGKRRSFTLPVHLGGTEFQNRVWSALSDIPFGETRTYQQQAAALRLPNAARAVGRTNGLNPLSILLPCHRVVAKSGALTGYSGGLEAKRLLLELEAVACRNAGTPTG